MKFFSITDDILINLTWIKKIENNPNEDGQEVTIWYKDGTHERHIVPNSKYLELLKKLKEVEEDEN